MPNRHKSPSKKNLNRPSCNRFYQETVLFRLWTLASPSQPEHTNAMHCYPIYKNLFSGVKALGGPQVHALFSNQGSWGRGPRPPHLLNQGSSPSPQKNSGPPTQDRKIEQKKADLSLFFFSLLKSGNLCHDHGNIGWVAASQM